jgi:hypothetical protein
LQEDIERRSIAVSVSAAKLTGRALAKALQAVLRKMRQGQGHTPQGRQSVKKLVGHNANTNTIPLDGDTRLFDRVARKYHVDYSFKKTEPGKYLLFFKSGQADAITACFAEYTKRAMTKSRKPSIQKGMEQAAEKIWQRPKEREHRREAAHDNR